LSRSRDFEGQRACATNGTRMNRNKTKAPPTAGLLIPVANSADSCSCGSDVRSIRVHSCLFVANRSCLCSPLGLFGTQFLNLAADRRAPPREPLFGRHAEPLPRSPTQTNVAKVPLVPHPPENTAEFHHISPPSATDCYNEAMAHTPSTSRPGLFGSD
jgi:hypothetical protein